MQVGDLVRFADEHMGLKWIVDTGLVLDVSSPTEAKIYWMKRQVVCEQRKVFLEVISKCK